MTEELMHMKYLKIEDNKAFFQKDGVQDEWIPIDQINKDHLFYLLNKAISDDFEMDEFKEELLSNQAHRIIYKNLFEKFTNLLSNKRRFKDESENLYKAAFEKYSTYE